MNYILMGIVVVGFIGHVSAQAGCGQCLHNHPQQVYCDSDIVMRVIVNYVDLDVRIDVIGYSAFSYNLANATVHTDFKPGLLETGTQIEFYSPSSICGTWFTEGYDYIITGSLVVDPANNDVLMVMNNCDQANEWDELSSKQRKGFESKYGRFCDCAIIGVRSAMDLRVQLMEGGAGYEDAQSYWTPYRKCYYNPIKSAEFQWDDCEDMYGFCRSNEEGVCSWQLTTEYTDCFNEREAYVWTREGLRAITDISQCKVLLNRRQKKKCRKQFRQNQALLAEAEAAAPEVPEGAVLLDE